MDLLQNKGQRRPEDKRTQAALAATTSPPHHRPIATNDTGVQRDTDIRQQLEGMRRLQVPVRD